ncbi:MAG: ATP-binding protein [Vicinamibacterales bacterium]|nr:ATP-binding protein [Vicinamibacterales bacterium]
MMTDLPPRARLYVGGVIALGLVVFAAALPPGLAQPGLFVVLLAMSAMAAPFKVRLPLYEGGSTLSVSFAFDFTALLLLDLPEAMMVAGLSAWVQCAIRPAEAYPAYRTIFSVAGVMLSVAGASLVYTAIGGRPTLDPLVSMIGPVLAAGTTFFVVNSVLVGIAIALSTGDSLRRVWYENLLWSAPGYVIGSLFSALVALLILRHGALVAPAVFIPALLSFRAYETYVSRIEIEQQHVRQVSELHAAATEALAQARRSEQALAAEKERLSVTLGSIADGVVTTDTTGRIRLMNRVAEELIGQPQSTALDQPFDRVCPLLDRGTGRPLPSPVDEALGADCALEGDLIGALDTSGTRRLVGFKATPMHDRDGVVIGAVLVLRDITAAMRLEEERARASKLESLGTLAGGIAHDFNNIMTTIVGNLSLVTLQPDLEPTIARRITEAERACARAKTLTKQLLTFSKGGAPVKAPTELGTLLAEATGFALRGSNVRCELDVAPDLWPILGDAGQLAQVVHNLVLNAVQAMPEGGVVRVRAANATRHGVGRPGGLTDGDYVRILVEDRGTGIPAHLLPKIFDPYFTTRQDGSGLGLATCYSIVRNHGGEIAVHSTVSVGTTVDIHLPRSLAAPRAVPAPPQEFTHAARARVLVMDDEDSIRDLVGEMLTYLGYEPTLTRDGEEAIQAFTEAQLDGRPFDAVIMDLTIPGGMGGKEAIQRLRQIDASTRAIVSSGYADDPVMANYEAFGFSGVVAKPYALKDLGRALDALLQPKAVA